VPPPSAPGDRAAAFIRVFARGVHTHPEALEVMRRSATCQPRAWAAGVSLKIGWSFSGFGAQ
jgi:hypothetical protein